MLSLSDIVNVKVGIGRGVFEAPGAIVIGGKKPSFNLEILKLFANGEQGFWYDPNDLSTMFQDAAGKVPVTAVGQPVGLILDKSKGLRTSAVNTAWDGTFANGFTSMGAAAHWKIVEGRAYHAFASEPLALTLSIPASQAGTYIEFDAEVLSGNQTAQVQVNGVSTLTYDFGTGHHKVYLPPGAYSFQFKRNPSLAGSEFYIDNVTVGVVAGNHAYQTTSASRPILRQNATTGAYYLELDGSDDFLVVSSHKAFDESTLIVANKLRKFTGSQPIYSKAQGGYLYLGGNFANIQRYGDNFSASNNPTGDVQSAVYSYNGNLNNHLVTLTTNSAEKTENTTALGLKVAGEGFIGRFSSTGTAYAGIDLYGIMVIEKVMPRTELDTFRQHYNKRLGVTLNV